MLSQLRARARCGLCAPSRGPHTAQLIHPLATNAVGISTLAAITSTAADPTAPLAMPDANAIHRPLAEHVASRGT